MPRAGIAKMERTTQTEITFAHPFTVSSLVVPLEAGTYRLIMQEVEIEGLSFSAFRRTNTHLEIPAIAACVGTRQLLRVSMPEIEAALENDANSNDRSRTAATSSPMPGSPRENWEAFHGN